MNRILAAAVVLGAGVAAAQQLGRIHLPEPPDDEPAPARSVMVDLTRDHGNPAPTPAPTPLFPIPAPVPTPDDTPGAWFPRPVGGGGESELPLPATPPASPPPTNGGLVVRVAALHGNAAAHDPAALRVNAPFPAKPVGAVPHGWKLVRGDSLVPVLATEAELAPGSKVQLEIRPHVLVAAADGRATFALTEPGFDPALEYRQNSTVAALLGEAVKRLAEEEEQLATTIRKLENLLNALPAADP